MTNLQFKHRVHKKVKSYLWYAKWQVDDFAHVFMSVHISLQQCRPHLTFYALHCNAGIHRHQAYKWGIPIAEKYAHRV